MLGEQYNMISLEQLLVLVGIASASEVPVETFNITEEYNLQENTQPYYINPDELTCLADNIYFEARNQGTAGWQAVAAVTLNRVKDTRFPNTVCEVVKQGPTRKSWKNDGTYYPVRHRCQFSWYCDGMADVIHPKDEKIYNKIEDLAELAMIPTVNLLDITDGATHYHADYVLPSWAATKTKTVEIGDHIFYRWEK